MLVVASAGSLIGCGASLNSEPGASFAQAGANGSGDAGANASITTASLGAKEQTVALPDAAKPVALAATPGNSAYKIGPQDLLEVSVFKVPELSKSVQVADTGTVNLPLVGEVPAAGRTAQDVERDLTKKLGAKYLQSPQVTVLVKEYNSQRVTVEGAVKKPGVFPLRGQTSLLQSIATAGGLDTNVASSEVVVFRRANGKRAAAKFNLDDIKSGQADDPELAAGDVVVVADSALKAAFSNFIKAIPAAGAFALVL